MNIRKQVISIFATVAVLTCTQAPVSAQNYVFTQYSAGTDVPSAIRSITVQDNGCVWMCSDEGVARKDNVSVRLYTKNSSKQGAIPSNNVKKVVIDQNGNPWILTDAGTSRYFEATDNFQNYELVADAAVNADGTTYFASGNTLYIYNSQTDSFEPAFTDMVSSKYKVDAMFPWKMDQILLFSKRSGFAALDTETGKVNVIPLDEECKGPIYVDSRSRVWFATNGGGLAVFDGVFRHIPSFHTPSAITDFTECRGKIYIATQDGIMIYTPESDELEHLVNNSDSRASLPANNILSLAAVGDNALVAGRARGGFFTILLAPIESSAISVPGKYFLCPDGLCAIGKVSGDDRIWCMTDGHGFASYNPQNSTFKRYDSTSGLHPTSMALLPDGRFLFYNSNDRFRTFDPRSGKVSDFSFGSPILDLNSSSTTHIVSKGPGDIIFISTENSLYIYDAVKKELKTVYVPAEAYGHTTIVPCRNDEGQLFHNSRYILKYDASRYALGILHDAGEDSNLTSMSRDSEGNIWTVSAAGLGKLNAKDGTYEPYANEFVNGLNGVTVDKSGRVWVTDNKNVFVFVPEENTFFRLTPADGVNADTGYSASNILATDNGEVYFAGASYFIRVPASFDTRIPKLQGMKLSAVTVGSSRVDATETFKLKSPGKEIDFHLTAANDLMHETGNFRLRISSGKKEHIINSDLPVLSFTPQNAGRYTIEASCAGTNCKWTEWEKVGSFKVMPKWSESWWFYLALFAISFLIMLVVFKKFGTGGKTVEEDKKESEPKTEPEDETTSREEAPLLSEISETNEGGESTDGSKLAEPIQDELKLEDASILIVEDDIELRSYVKSEILMDVKHVFTASNGVEAIKVLNSQVIDVIVSDVMMPEMDGFAFCRYVKTTVEISHIPVILLTARADENSRIMGYKNGADDYITKPFDIDFLKSSISNLFHGRAIIHKKYQTYGIIPSASETTFSSADEAFLKKFDDIVQKYISDPELEVGRIVNEIGMSRTVLFNKVKQLTGLNIQGYINKCRMEYVIKLMSSTDLPLADIAERSGFSTPRYFSTSFKNYTGKTPSQFKKEMSEK